MHRRTPRCKLGGMVMQFMMVTLPVVALVTAGFGQSLPVTSITGQPFSADEVIIENPKPNVRNVLPMKIIRIYRDSAGRTREDVSIPPDSTATQVVNIEDPIAGVHYSLDAQSKIARRLVYPQQLRSALNAPMSAPGISGSVISFKSREVQTKAESLGTQLIDGLAAEGQRIASISPVSLPGCDEQVAVSDSWYSPELRITLLQKRTNCMGGGITRLEHISRAEPNPLLFQVPSDYTIVDRSWTGPSKVIRAP